MNKLKQVDEYFLRELLRAHSKTPKEMLFLETGVIPLDFILRSRRLSYLHHILTRNPDELIYRVFKAQERIPIKDDWIYTVRSDMNYLNLNMTNDEISKLNKRKF